MLVVGRLWQGAGVGFSLQASLFTPAIRSQAGPLQAALLTSCSLPSASASNAFGSRVIGSKAAIIAMRHPGSWCTLLSSCRSLSSLWSSTGHACRLPSHYASTATVHARAFLVDICLRKPAPAHPAAIIFQKLLSVRVLVLQPWLIRQLTSRRLTVRLPSRRPFRCTSLRWRRRDAGGR